MKMLDGRHRWELVGQEGMYVTHRCRSCGITQTFEKLLPDAFVESVTRQLLRANPYRSLLR